MKGWLTAVGLLLLYLLRFDFWLWQRPDLVLGLPVGLLYHTLFCVAVSAFLWLVVRTLIPGPRR